MEDMRDTPAETPTAPSPLATAAGAAVDPQVSQYPSAAMCPLHPTREHAPLGGTTAPAGDTGGLVWVWECDGWATGCGCWVGALGADAEAPLVPQVLQ